MQYYIIIRGPLGVGKSTVAKEVAKRLHGEYISIDAVLAKQKLDYCPPNAPCIPASHFLKATKSILPKLRRTLRNKIVVLDGNFYHKAQLKQLETLHVPHYTFTLKASLKKCIERDSKRKRGYGVGAACAVHNLVSRFDAGTVIPTGNLTIEGTVRTILARLPHSQPL
jgi:shikimate kinase